MISIFGSKYFGVMQKLDKSEGQFSMSGYISKPKAGSGRFLNSNNLIILKEFKRQAIFICK
jgi:hypothetical protein